MEKFKSFNISTSMFNKTKSSPQVVSSEYKDKQKDALLKLQRNNNDRTFSKTTRSIYLYETKANSLYQLRTTTYEQNRINNNPQRKPIQSIKKLKPATVEDIIIKSLKISNEFYSKQPDFKDSNIKQSNKNKIIEFNKTLKEKILIILKNIKSKPKVLLCHLNTMYYSTPNVKVLAISQIEKQICKQWRQNILLSSVRSQWFLCLQEFLPNFGLQGYSIFQQIIYRNFCSYLAYLSYVIFQPYYSLQLQNKLIERSEIIDRLYKRTVRFVVTQSKHWQKIAHTTIFQMIKPKIIYTEITSPHLSSLYQITMGQMKSIPFKNLFKQNYSNSIPFFPTVKPAIIRFINQHYIPHKLKCITQIRSCLEQDIMTHQQQLIKRNTIKDFEMFEKDSMLTCLILAVLNSQISLNQIEIALKQVKLMLGQDLQEILRIFKCPSYFTDLQAVVQFLVSQVQKLNK